MENELQRSNENVVTIEGIVADVKETLALREKKENIAENKDIENTENKQIETVSFGGQSETSENSATLPVEVDAHSLLKEELKKNPNFIAGRVLDKIGDTDKINLDDVWFVKTVDKTGRFKIEPYVKQKSKKGEGYICCLNGGWIYKEGNYAAFSVLDGFVSSKRWQAMELETLLLSETLKDSDKEAMEYQNFGTSMESGRPNHEYKIAIDFVITGKTTASVIEPATKKSMNVLQQENYRKFLGKACYKIYSMQTKRVVDCKTIREYAKAYEDRINASFVEQSQDKASEPISVHELSKTGRVNLESLFFVTRRVDDRVEVLPCVVNQGKHMFVDASSGNVYNLDDNGGFTTISGFISAKRWREMELSCLKIVENYTDRTAEGEEYLNHKMLDGGILTPRHVYSISISGVMTKGTRAYLYENAVNTDFVTFRDKSCKHSFGVELLQVLDPKFKSISTVEDVCKFARDYTERLNPKIQARVDHSDNLNEIEMRFYENDQMQLNKKDKSSVGVFKRLKQYFSNRKRLKNAKTDYENEK